MISALSDSLLTLDQARRLRCLRHPVSGNPRHPSAIRRYVKRGVHVNGHTVRLEAVRVAGQWYTTAAAVEEFIARQTNPGALIIRSEIQRQRASAKCDRELAESGW